MLEAYTGRVMLCVDSRQGWRSKPVLYEDGERVLPGCDTYLHSLCTCWSWHSGRSESDAWGLCPFATLESALMPNCSG